MTAKIIRYTACAPREERANTGIRAEKRIVSQAFTREDVGLVKSQVKLLTAQRKVNYTLF
jgi:hypothetical protein